MSAQIIPFKTAAQLAYEADVRARPTYRDGTPRKPWKDLCDVARRSWQGLAITDDDLLSAYGGIAFDTSPIGG